MYLRTFPIRFAGRFYSFGAMVVLSVMSGHCPLATVI